MSTTHERVSIVERLGEEPLDGRFVVLDAVEGGVGLQAVVLRARDRSREGEPFVAVKVLRSSWLKNEPAFGRFRREVEVLLRLSRDPIASRHVVRLVAAGMWSAPGESIDYPYLVLEWMDGGTLRRLFRRGIPTPLPVVVELCDQIVQGIAALHAAGVVHRDLKPENVLASGSPQRPLLKLADLGMAGFDRMITTQTIGLPPGYTPGYAAPEQYRQWIEYMRASIEAQSMDPATAVGREADVFAFACLAFEIMTGEAAYGAVSSDPSSLLAAAEAVQGSLVKRRRTLEKVTGFSSSAIDELISSLSAGLAPAPADRDSDVVAFWERLERTLSRGMSTRLRGILTTAPDLRITVDPTHGATLVELPADEDGDREETSRWSWAEAQAPALASAATSMLATVGHLSVAAGPAGLWRWDGFGWAQTRLPEGVDPARLRAVTRLTERRYLIAGLRGLVAFLARGEWRLLEDDASRDWTAAWADGDQTYVLAGASRKDGAARVARYADGAWTTWKLDGPKGVRMVAGRAGRATCFVLTDDGAIYACTPQGPQPYMADNPVELCALVVSEDGHVLAVGERGLCLHIDAIGSPYWEQTPTTCRLTAIAESPDGTVWAAGGGAIVRRTGSRWRLYREDPEALGDVGAIACIEGRVVVACPDGRIVEGNLGSTT